jgi:hypothetical protein
VCFRQHGTSHFLREVNSSNAQPLRVGLRQRHFSEGGVKPLYLLQFLLLVAILAVLSMESFTLTRVKEEFIALCCPASCVVELIDEFIGPLLSHAADESQSFCNLLRKRFDEFRIKKLNSSLRAIRAAAYGDEQAEKLTEEARVQLRTLCVFLAARNLELSRSLQYFNEESFSEAYPDFKFAPDVEDLLRFRNIMAGERAFQPLKAEVGKSLKMCVCLAHGSGKKFSTGGGVPTMERVAQFASGHRAVDWVARRQFIFYRETGTKPKRKPAKDGACSTSGSEPSVRSKRKVASCDDESVSSYGSSTDLDLFAYGKRSRGDSMDSSGTTFYGAGAVPATVQLDIDAGEEDFDAFVDALRARDDHTDVSVTDSAVSVAGEAQTSGDEMLEEEALNFDFSEDSMPEPGWM